MRHIDLRNGTLANRVHAGDALERLRLDESGPRPGLVLDFDDNLATMSWLDGYLTPIVEDSGNGTVVVLCSSEDTGEHIAATLRRRGLAVLAASSRDQLHAGRFQLLGDVTGEQREAFDVVTTFGHALVADVASALELTVEAAQQRLTDLLHKRLIQRERDGRAYVYSVPALSLAALAVA